jgi:acyl-CoA thioester hydrolase
MVSKSRIVVRYAETDKMGIVHHSNYPVWYEVGRTDFTKCLGFTYSQLEEKGLVFPLISIESCFIKPAFYEDELTVEVSLKVVTPGKLTFGYKVWRDNTGELINTGQTIHGILDKHMKPVRMKKLHSDIYEKLQLACESLERV